MLAFARAEWGKQEPSLSQRAGRGAGLAARSVLEGFASLPLAAADLAAYPINAISRAISGEEAIPSYRETFSRGLSEAGLPVPESGGERLLSAVGAGASGALGGIGIGQQLAGSASPVVAGVGNILRTAPGAQAVAGGSAGGSGELARQAGLGPAGQTVAAVTGGLAGGMAASALSPKVPVPREIGRTGPPTHTAQQVDELAQAGTQRLGLQWGSLDDGLKTRVQRNIDDALTINSDLTPEALARKAVYESLGIKPTRALITRNFDDALNEQNLLTEPEGAAIRQLYAQNNRAFQQQIRSLAPEGVSPTDRPTFGAALRAPVAKGELRSQQLANKVFNRAMEAEGGNRATVQPLVDYLQDNIAILNATNAGKPVIAYLQKMGIIDPDNMQQIATPKSTSPTGVGFKAADINLRELSALRKVVNTAWKSATNSGDDTAAAQLNQMRGLLNQAEGNAGGELFKAYRQLRTAKAGRYEDNPLIDKLLSDKRGYRGTDLIEDSEVFSKAVLGSSPEQFSKLWPRLTPKAKRLTQAQTARYIEERAFNNMATNEQGDIVASAAKLNQALDALSPQKMRLIYGAEKAERIGSLNQALREISNPPRGTVPQGSAPKLTYLTRNILKLIGMKLPVIGDSVTKSVEDAARSKASQAAADRAINTLPAPAPASTGGAQVAPLLLPVASQINR